MIALINPVDHHLHPAIVEQDAAASDHLIGQLVVGDRGDLLATGHIARGEGEGITFGHRDRSSTEAAKADLRALQVLEDADVGPHLLGYLPDRADAGRMLAVIAVGEVEPEGGGSCLDQAPQLLRRFGGRADGGHDLGATREIGQGHSAGPKLRPTLSSKPASPALPMDLNAYQQGARSTARYPDVGSNPIYPTLGLCGEAGEVADKVKKVLRDQGGSFTPEVREALKLELGDVLWYVAQLSSELGFELAEIAEANLNKLASRAARNVIAGSGDHR